MIILNGRTGPVGQIIPTLQGVDRGSHLPRTVTQEKNNTRFQCYTEVRFRHMSRRFLEGWDGCMHRLLYWPPAGGVTGFPHFSLPLRSKGAFSGILIIPTLVSGA